MAGDVFSKADFAAHDFRRLDARPTEGRVLRTLAREVRSPPSRRSSGEDDPDNVEWRNRMVAALIGEEDQTISEESLLGLSSEFFMQIEWLPGGRIEEGELIFDSILADAGSERRRGLERLCDEKPQKFIFNFVREYGDLEYVNIGRVVGSLSQRPAFYGRRDVYIAGAQAARQRQGHRQDHPHAEDGASASTRRGTRSCSTP